MLSYQMEKKNPEYMSSNGTLRAVLVFDFPIFSYNHKMALVHNPDLISEKSSRVWHLYGVSL